MELEFRAYNCTCGKDHGYSKLYEFQDFLDYIEKLNNLRGEKP